MKNDDELKKAMEVDQYPQRVRANISDDEIEKVLKDAKEQLESDEGKKNKEKKSVAEKKDEKVVEKDNENKVSIDEMKKEKNATVEVPKFQKKEKTEKISEIKDVIVVEDEVDKADAAKEVSKEESKKEPKEEPKQSSVKTKETPRFVVPLVEEVAKEEKSVEPIVKNKDDKTDKKKEETVEVVKKEEPSKKKSSKDKEKEWKVEEEEPFVMQEEIPDDPVYGVPRKMTFGRAVGLTLEVLWTAFKIAFVVLLVTAISGFLLSRTMMIRGRNGNRQCLENVTYSSTVLANKEDAEEEVEKWLEDVKYEKVTLETDDGSILVAKKFKIYQNSNKWAVILHGYNGDTTDVYDIARKYTVEGYNVLLPDLRAHGESEGHFIGMGWLDRLDVINWIDTILDENAEAQVVVHGIDMGAATALMMTGSPLKDCIKAVVAEGAYSNAQDVVKMEYEARYEKLPAFPFFYMMNPVMEVWAGYSLSEADAVQAVAGAKVPILLIHGANDTYATKEMTDELNGAIASSHKLVTIQTGGHEDCRYAEPDNYYDAVFDFVKTYIK